MLASPDSAMQPAANTSLQHYTLQQQIGAGGMGTVWAARDDRSGAAVALKILRTNDSAVDVSRARLLREAHATRTIAHPAVVPVIDVLEHDGNPVLVMDLLRGETLRQRLEREQSLSIAAASALLVPIAEALSAAHEVGIVHRDLKPENIFIQAADGHSPARTRLLDFGVARFYEPPADTGDQPLTGLGVLIGTLAYMAPEQALRPSECDSAVDAWALGVILYETLSGIRPIEGNTGPEILRKILLGGITPLRVLRPDLPAEITELITSMLSKSPAQRPHPLSAVAALLQRFV
jgi:eukaryotic-like serine/threonine-protein kinase